MLLVRWGPRTAATAGVRVVWSCRTVQQPPPRIAFEVERRGHRCSLGGRQRSASVQGKTRPNFQRQKSTVIQQLGRLPRMARRRQGTVDATPGFLTRVQTEFAVKVPR